MPPYELKERTRLFAIASNTSLRPRYVHLLNCSKKLAPWLVFSLPR